jgi:hypothetical protein
VKADSEPLRNFFDRVAPLGDLRNRIAFEVVAELARVHHGLLASKLGKKAFTIHGAIHLLND